jgi:hypothetical protein
VNPVYLSLITLLGTLVIVSLGAILNNSRLSDLKSLIEGNHANVRSSLEDLRRTIDARFAEQKAELLRVEQAMDARLRHLEEIR